MTDALTDALTALLLLALEVLRGPCAPWLVGAFFSASILGSAGNKLTLGAFMQAVIVGASVGVVAWVMQVLMGGR